MTVMNNEHDFPSAYIPFYSMTREPFGDEVENDLYYPEPLRKQRLEILLHLTQYSNELMLVIGPPGSGKTTLLQQYQQQALETWAIARIEAGMAPDDRQFLQQLYRQMSLEFRGASHSELTERMDQHFVSLQRNGRQAVMLVDDAHLLPVNTLKNILIMARLTNAEAKPLIRVILFGTRALVQNLQDTHLGHHATIAKRSIEVPPFNLEQTANYILHRLSAAGYSASTPFTDSAINKIHKRSGGWPGNIHQLARQCLIDSLPAAPKPKGPVDDLPSTVRPLRVLALGITIVLISILLIYQDDVNQWFTPSGDSSTETADSNSFPLALPQPDVITGNPDSETDTRANTARDEEMASTIVANAPETPATETNASAPPQPDLIEKPPISAVEVTPITLPSLANQDASSIAAKAAPSSDPTPAPDVQTPTPPPPAAATSPAPTAVTTPPAATDTTEMTLPSRGNSWVQSQNPQHFTLQMVAGNNLETLDRFIREHNLSDNLAVYHAQRDGKPWHGLLYGLYSTKQGAIDARSQLPAALRQAQPWIRDLGGIQKGLQ